MIALYIAIYNFVYLQVSPLLQIKMNVCLYVCLFGNFHSYGDITVTSEVLQTLTLHGSVPDLL